MIGNMIPGFALIHSKEGRKLAARGAVVDGPGNLL